MKCLLILLMILLAVGLAVGLLSSLLGELGTGALFGPDSAVPPTKAPSAGQPIAREGVLALLAEVPDVF